MQSLLPVTDEVEEADLEEVDLDGTDNPEQFEEEDHAV